MTREQALKRAIAKWGKRALIACHERVFSSPEKRAQAQADANTFRHRINAIDAEIKAIVDAIPAVQALRTERATLAARLKTAVTIRESYRFEIGFSRDAMADDDVGGAVGFHVEAQGDTWEECFAKLVTDRLVKS